MMISSSIRWSLAGIGRRLDDEHVAAAHVFLDLDEDLHVGEAPHHGLGQRGLEIGGDRVGERGIGVAGDELDRSVIGPPSLVSRRAPARSRRPDNKEAARLAIRPQRGFLSRNFR